MRVETGWTPDANRTFAETVKAERLARGWSQEQLAERMRETGADFATQVLVSRIEKGTRELRIADAFAVAAALGIGVMDLLHWEVASVEAELRAAMHRVQRGWDQLLQDAETLLSGQEELARVADEAAIDGAVIEQEVLRLLRLGPEEMLRRLRSSYLIREGEAANDAGYSVEDFRRQARQRIVIGDAWPTLEKTWSAVYGEHPEAS